MKKLLFAILFGSTLLLAGQGTSPAERQLQSAINKEVVQGDLKGAIKLYQDIISKYKDNRQVAAKALVRMGGCYERLGTTDAEKAYRQVITNYPDQAEAVRTASSRLNALAVPSTGTVASDFVLQQTSIPSGPPSPDGKYVAFVDYDSKMNAADLCLSELTTGKKIILTNLGLGKPQDSYSMVEDWSITWADDGSKIAFTASETIAKTDRTFLFIIDSNGANLKAMPFDTVYPIGWSAAKPELLCFDWNKSLILAISVPDGKQREIMAIHVPPDRRIGVPKLSADKKHIAYEIYLSSNQRSRDIRISALDGSLHETVIEHPAEDWLMGWAQSGHILFTSNRTGNWAIWMQQVDGGNKLGAPNMITAVRSRVKSLGITTSGSLFYSERSGGTDVFTAQMDLKTGKVLRDPENVEPKFTGHCSTPFWSSDGETLGYLVSNESGAYTNYNSLRFRSLKNKISRDVPLDFEVASLQQVPRWSKDGRFICLKGYRPKLGLYRVDIATAQSQLICEGNVGAWNSDGTVVYLQKPPMNSAGPTKTIIRRDLRTNDEQVIFQGEGRYSVNIVGLSPDGKWLGGSGPEFTFWVMPADSGVSGGLQKQFARKENNLMGALFFWAPFGNGLLFETRKTGDKISRLAYLPSFDSKEFLNLNLEMPRINGLTFHPDGKTVAFNTISPDESKVWVLENYLPSKK